MHNLRKAMMWALLLTKRLYKKLTFVLLLLMIPVLVFVYVLASQEESGMLTIQLASNGASDAVTCSVIADLSNSSELIRFVEADSAQSAEFAVRTGKADAAWIFPEDLQNHIDAFVQNEKNDGFVRVIEREETVPLRLAREKLTGVLYPYFARAYYLQYIRENGKNLETLTDAQLLAYYDSVNIENKLFDHSYVDPGKSAEPENSSGYLTVPVRGLLAIICVIGGLATAMYYVQDEKNGLFSWLPGAKKTFVELGYQLISAINLNAAALISLSAAGLAEDFGSELLLMLLYSFCSSVFCMLLRVLLGNLPRIGTILPLLAVAMLGICPVFFDLGLLREVQYLFPPTYCINGLYNSKFLVYMVIYTLTTWVLYYAVGKFKKRF